MYTTNNMLSELLAQDAAKDLFDQIMPGMRESETFGFFKDLPLKIVMQNAPEKMRSLYELIVDAANGKEVHFTPIDPKLLKPEIMGELEVSYDIEDIDGSMFMLDHRFGGCLIAKFSKVMDENGYGKVSCMGKELPKGNILKIKAAGGMQMCGIPVRKCFTEYDKEYELLLEEFMDVDGNVMDPVVIKVHTLPRSQPDLAYESHDNIALEAAREGIVLLKNEDNTLPLKKDTALSIYGGDEFRLGAYGAGRINPRYSVGLLRGIAEYSDFSIEENASTVLVVISRASGENLDNHASKGEYYLSDKEEALLAELQENGKKIIAILSTGYPMDVTWMEKYHVSAALWCGFSGMLGGRALVEILDGRVNPSGKLPDTWSLDYWDHPSSRNFYLPKEGEPDLVADDFVYIDTCYEEGIYVGYRYFETFDQPTAYSFGHGLSYTAFEMRGSMQENKICVNVKNTGKCSGKEVVQAYVSIPEGKLEQPRYRLIGFAKTKELEPGEEQLIEIEVKKENLTSWDEKTACWILEKGNYRFYIGDSIDNVEMCGEYQYEAEIVKQSEHLVMSAQPLDVFSSRKNNFPEGKHSGVKEVNEITPKAARKHYEEPEREEHDWIDDLSEKELARISVCGSHGWGMHEKGEAGRICKIEDHDIPDYAVADGNNGVNVHHKNIGMPCSNTVCATWNALLAYKVGQVIAQEAKENDIQMILAPAMNLHRNPLNGRHPEYFSEDPLLGGIMAGNQAKGLEDEGISSSMKHVIGNNCEASRKCNQSIIPERAMRELYLKTFEIAFGVHKPDSIMTGYNAVNGCFCASDEELIQGIFRKEFGFEGFVMTDWNSYDTAGVVEPVSAGNAWMTPGTMDDTYTSMIEKGVEEGKIEIARLRENVRSIMNIIKKRA